MSIKKKFAVFNSIIQRFQQLLVKCSYHNNEMFTIKLTITKDIMVLAITHWNRWFKYFIPKQAIQRATYFSRKNVYTVLRIILLISSLLYAIFTANIPTNLNTTMATSADDEAILSSCIDIPWPLDHVFYTVLNMEQVFPPHNAVTR